MKNESVLIRNSLNESTPITVPIIPTNNPTPEQLAAVPSKRARPASAWSVANRRIYCDRLCRFMRKRVNVNEVKENNKILREIGTKNR